MDWDGVKPGLGWLNGITHDIFLDFSDELILFLWSMCLLCQMIMSGSESGRACSASLLDLSLCDTHPTRTLGGFPTVVSG